MHDVLVSELKRIEGIGVKFVTSCRVDKAKFAQIQQENDAVVVATGGHESRYFNWEGKELLTMGLDFLKKVNAGLNPKVGKRVVVIGCGKTVGQSLAFRNGNSLHTVS